MTSVDAESKFIPSPTPDTEPFWNACSQGRLSLPHCSLCGPFFYPRSYCPACGRRISVWRDMSGRARLVSYVINHRPAPGFESETPYVVALVELEEGPRMLTNLVGIDPSPEAITLDIDLVVDFQQRGDGAIPVFRPKAGLE